MSFPLDSLPGWAAAGLWGLVVGSALALGATLGYFALRQRGSRAVGTISASANALSISSNARAEISTPLPNAITAAMTRCGSRTRR